MTTERLKEIKKQFAIRDKQLEERKMKDDVLEELRNELGCIVDMADTIIFMEPIENRIKKLKAETFVEASHLSEVMLNEFSEKLEQSENVNFDLDVEINAHCLFVLKFIEKYIEEDDRKMVRNRICKFVENNGN